MDCFRKATGNHARATREVNKCGVLMTELLINQNRTERKQLVADTQPDLAASEADGWHVFSKKVEI